MLKLAKTTEERAKNLEVADEIPQPKRAFNPPDESNFDDGEVDYTHHLPYSFRSRGWTLWGGRSDIDPNRHYFNLHPPARQNSSPITSTFQNGQFTFPQHLHPDFHDAIRLAAEEHAENFPPMAPREVQDTGARFRNLELSEKANGLLAKLKKSLGKMEVKASWLGHPILDEKHIPDLEQKAAFYQLHDDLSKEEAEKKTYAEYTKARRAEAGLHHLKSAKMALLAGDQETARKHGLMYQLHNKALGGDAIGPAHPDIVGLSGQPTDKKHPFKSHDGDIYIGDLEKSEDRKGKQKTCYCKAYLFPHRWKSHPGCPGEPATKTKP